MAWGSVGSAVTTASPGVRRSAPVGPAPERSLEEDPRFWASTHHGIRDRAVCDPTACAAPRPSSRPWYGGHSPDTGEVAKACVENDGKTHRVFSADAHAPGSWGGRAHARRSTSRSYELIKGETIHHGARVLATGGSGHEA